MNYEKPNVSVDVVLLTLISGRLHVAIKPREAAEPASEHGKFEVTGGYIHTNEDVDSLDAAKRTLRAKLNFEPRYMEQVYTVANAHRDPRGWSASIVYLALHDAVSLADLVAERGLHLVDVEDGGNHLPDEMAFDHKLLISAAVERLRAKAAYSTIVAHLLPPEFMIPDLHEAFQSIRQKVVNASNFRTKIMKENVLVETDGRLFSHGRPGIGYKLAAPIAYFTREIA